MGVVDMVEDDIGNDQGAGIDERITGNPAFIFELHQGVKWRAGRLPAHPLPE